MTKKEKLVAVRIPWEVWKALDLVRADRQRNKTTSLSDILREAIDNYIGEPCKKTSNH